MINKVLIPSTNKFAHFMPRDQMGTKKIIKTITGAPWPKATLPINNYKNFAFPIDGNDTYGDCGAAMASHGQNTFMGMNGIEYTVDVKALENQYLKVSGGDSGLDEDMVVNQIWKKGIAGDPKAIIYDALDIDPNDANAMQSAIQNFGCVCFSLSVPIRWINGFQPDGSTIWDGPAIPDPMNGHYVLINGVDKDGNYHTLTWGSYVTLTPRGVALCQPGAFTVFSPRWFNPNTGLDPTGATYASKAALWTSLGGISLPPNPFPNPTPTPTPTPNPVPPAPGLIATTIKLTAHPETASIVAQVTANSGSVTPTGLVIFNGVRATPMVNGIAVLGNLEVGPHTITAIYKANGNFAASAQQSISITVPAPGPTPVPVPPKPTPTPTPPKPVSGLTLQQIIQIIEAGRPYGLNAAGQIETAITKAWPK